MNESDYLEGLVKLGIRFEILKESETGQALIQQAGLEVLDLYAELAKVEPTNTADVRRLQNEIKLRHMALSWIDQFISTGQNAADEFDIGESDDN